MKRLRGNNKGLSLIEVLVAIVILSIVVVPFLHSFVTTANTNTKAKRAHKATVLAQSVMEGFKAEELEDIAKQFVYPGQGFGIVDPARINGGTALADSVEELRYDAGNDVYEQVITYENPLLAGVSDKKSMVTASIYSEDMGGVCEFLGQADGLYYFSLENVQEDSSVYDVLVKLDAAKYRSGEAPYNGEDLVLLPVLDSEKDALCMQKNLYTENAVAEFAALYPEVDEDLIRQSVKRTITVTVDGAGADKVTVNAEYKYTYQKNASEPVREYVKEQIAFDSSVAGTDLRNVYLYYYPLYPVADGTVRDEIVFSNTSGIPLDLYLFKQQGSDTTVGTETRYCMKLFFLDKPGAGAGSMAVRLHTNLGLNIADANMSPTASGNYQVFLNGSSVSLESVTVENILDTKVSDRVFDIDVEVYESGAGGLNYPGEMRLASMTGTKLK